MAFYMATTNSEHKQKLTEALEGFDIKLIPTDQELLDMISNFNDETNNESKDDYTVLFIDYEIYQRLNITQYIDKRNNSVLSLILLCDSLSCIDSNNLPPKTIFVLTIDRFSSSEIRIIIQLQAHNMKHMEKLHNDACLDDLTKVCNRRAFMYSLEKSFFNFKQEGITFCLAYLDVDHFKVINDTFGHVKGDQLLENIGKVLRHSCRNTDIIGRIGGEEFAIIFPKTSIQHASDVLERIRANINTSADIDDSVRVTLSGGLTSSSPLHNSHVEMIKEADLLLYKAKDWGRNQICQ